MIIVRKARERGHAQLGWLDSWHTFSFSSYYDPQHMGYHSLRVINDDRVAPGKGFGTHGHEDMEILTYVLEGELAHRDSMGTVAVLRPGDVQRMSAGTGLTHSEFNHSQTDPVHFLQIWIEPEASGVVPSYQDKHFTVQERTGTLRLIASHDGRDGSMPINQDVEVRAGLLTRGGTVTHALAPGRHAWVQVARGSVEVDGVALGVGDGAAVSGQDQVVLRSTSDAEVLLFDLA